MRTVNSQLFYSKIEEVVLQPGLNCNTVESEEQKVRTTDGGLHN